MAGWPGANWQVSLITTQSQASRSRFSAMNSFEVLAADFLFAFDQELQVQRQLAGGLDPGLGALDVREHLPLVVGRAAGVEVAVAHGRLERGRDPFVQRVGRLHVVVAVDQHRRAHRRRGGDSAKTIGWPGVSISSAAKPKPAELVAPPTRRPGGRRPDGGCRR